MKQVPKNPLIINMRAKQGVGFASQTNRFEAQKVSEDDRFLGPGLYEPTMPTKPLQKSSSVNFLTKAPRF